MFSVRVLVSVLISACFIVPAGARQAQYRILVTNDDGLGAPGLAAVAQILQAIGNVVIVAPAVNQSGTGHSITIADPIFRTDVTLPNGLQAIGLSATPASAMKLALQHLVTPRPDLVVSGINRGYNLGLSAYLSGTVGAAREAAMAGIPAIAASAPANTRDYGAAAEAVLGVARRAKQHGLPRYTFLNVNIPDVGDTRGYQVTTQAMSAGGSESFAQATHPSGRTYYWNVYAEGGEGPEGTDLWAVARGYVSVTPMRVGEAEPQTQEKVRAWFK